MSLEGSEECLADVDSLVSNIAFSHGTPQSPLRVRVPYFYRNNPQLWFVQLEASFRVNNVTDDRQRFDLVISNLEASIASLVEDLILTPPDENRYNSLKSKLLDLFSGSTDGRLQLQQQGGTAADIKPSDVLAQMKSITSGPGNDEVIRMLFIGQLPQSIRPLMSVWEEDNLDALAKTADKMLEAFTTNPSLVLPLASINVASDRLAEISAAVNNIKEDLSKLSVFGGKARSRSLNNPFCRSKSRVMKNKCGVNLCYYHITFGNRAVNCRRGCARW